MTKMEKEEVFHRMHNAILSLNNTKAIDAAQTVINEDFDISEFIENAMSPAIEEVGKKFQSGELWKRFSCHHAQNVGF